MPDHQKLAAGGKIKKLGFFSERDGVVYDLQTNAIAGAIAPEKLA